jgi:tRNA pseudouridine13 synthase
MPYLTHHLPGLGGLLKRAPEDFVVEEVPAYEPSGAGEHLFLWIEKRDVSAEQLVQHLADRLDVRRDDIGVAGLKDRWAVTRQYISVPASAEDRLAAVETDAIRVLQATRHRNKLRTGHLKGNRFDVLVRDVGPHALDTARPIAAVIAEKGFPNRYGEQRFGTGDETVRLGFALLAGRKTPRDIAPRRRKFLLRLAFSSVQSALFNEVLRERLTDGLLHRVLAGDVMQVVASGGCFVAGDVAREQSRFDAGETVVTGPLFGPQMKAPCGEPARREQRVLDRFEVRPERLAEHARLLPGGRRTMVARPERLEIAPDPSGLRFRFALPPGSYATVLLAEFMKT